MGWWRDLLVWSDEVCEECSEIQAEHGARDDDRCPRHREKGTMTPEEITALQDENARLRGENKRLEQLLTDARQRIQGFAVGIDAIRRIARQGIEEIERIESER